MGKPKVLVQSTLGDFHEKWIYYLDQNGADVASVDLRSSNNWNQIEACDGVMWHLSMKPSVLQSAETILSPIEFVLKKKVFPNYSTRWHYENKIAQKYLFNAMKVPTPKTYVFWEKEKAQAWIHKEAVFPLVHKGARGAGSRQVSLVSSRNEADKLINQRFSQRGAWNHKGYRNTTGRKGCNLLLTNLANICTSLADAVALAFAGKRPHLPKGYWMPEKDSILFQEFMPQNDYDTRITIIGDRAYGFRRVNRAGDFRASGGGSLDHDQNQIDNRMISMAFEVSHAGGFQSMAYDFLKDENGRPRICEMSFGYQNAAIFDCPGHWDSKLNYHKGHMWPEEAQVKDFLQNCNK